MTKTNSDALPEGISSILDTDLYKLTMQCAVLQHFPDTDVTYHFTNRTPDLKLTRKAFDWLKEQISKLSVIKLTDDELAFLKTRCPYLKNAYLDFLTTFRFHPEEQVIISFDGGNNPDDVGELNIDVKGLWVETILYEIPLLVLVSETFFKFVDTEWTYDRQEENAYNKGKTLLQAGAVFSEFGTRRRRSYHTQDLVMQGLIRAAKENPDATGKLNGSSNVHFCHRYDLTPVGTVAHEWYMGIAALHNDYVAANELGLIKWTETFGPGVLSIALTDTFGTKDFLRGFSKPCEIDGDGKGKSYAEMYFGVRQDSGDPKEFVGWMREFYDKMGIKDKKTIVFSDSLNIDLVLQYKSLAEEKGFNTSFGIGTFLTNDFKSTSPPYNKSTPLNIVIKLSSAAGNPAIKISDNVGKNTGDEKTVKKVKEELGYTEGNKEIDESKRW